MFVVSHYSPREYLIGIFSTEDKAKRAASEYMKSISSGKTISIEEEDGETLFSDGETCIHVTQWVVDKALVEGVFKTLE